DRSNRWPRVVMGRAPHKPCLLLAVVDMIALGIVNTNLIPLVLDLRELFGKYWEVAMPPDKRGNVATPFFHLKSEKVGKRYWWGLLPKEGQEGLLRANSIQSINTLQTGFFGAKLDEGLFYWLSLQEGRQALREVLIETHFAAEVRGAIWEQVVVNEQAFEYSELLLSQAKGSAKAKLLHESKEELLIAEPVRDQGFRRAIVKTYDQRCAFCGLRIVTDEGHTAIMAAHIIPWHVSYNDDPRNGIALCRLCHWAFDEGMMGMNKRYQIKLSPHLLAGENLPGHLPTLKGRELMGPGDRDLWPSLESVAWHGREVFRGGK
ncbi:MAG TPA: HNH endonuclease, partial [Anaerolineae bacterium]|nr:HNH endonuclease [Anaerolineae bacterium]